MYKKTLFLLTAILLLSFTSAGLGTFQQDTCVNIRTILNATAVNISSLSYPNNTVTFIDTPMTKNAQTFNYSFCDTGVIGDYIYDYYDNSGNVYVNDFQITYNGDDLTDAKAILYGVLLSITILFWFLVLYYTTKLPSKNGPDEEGLMQISKLKYMRDALYGVLYALSLSILFLASNIAIAYLPFQMFGDFLFILFQIMGWLSIPFVFLWLLWIFYSLVTDAKVKRYIERGMDFGGNNI